MIELQRLRVVFHPRTPDERVALDDVDLRLPAGTFTVVVGTNGAGKSTLLNAIAGSLRPASSGVMRRTVTRGPAHYLRMTSFYTDRGFVVAYAVTY